MQKERETLASRLGFILLSAGCAIGLGNVWKFPYITGKYGGGAFVLIYIIFLLILGLPVMVMEFSMGRAGQGNLAVSMKRLEKKGTHWHKFGYVAIIGNYLLMMFYTTITGWILQYIFKMASGTMSHLDPAGVAAEFGRVTGNPGLMVVTTSIAIIAAFIVCGIGLRKGVEKITKVMMSILIVLMVALAINSALIPGASEGLKFYLLPDFKRMGSYSIFEVLYQAMNQAFFTLSVGMGGMAIFGSYIKKDNSLTSESVRVIALDTFVAFMAGMIIFPACFSFGVSPDAGPSLVFVTIPNIFNQMMGGRFWGTLFFIFLFFAAFSTLIGVFENIIAFWQDLKGYDRKKICIVNAIAIIILSLPCILGFNVLSGFNPLGPGTVVLDLEDFLVSGTIMPLGSLLFAIFCTTRYGWGWKNFITEADSGKGLKFPRLRFYVAYVIPVLIIAIFVKGYWDIFSKLF